MEEQLIFEIWDTFRDHIPKEGREIAASQFVDFLVSKDVEIETFEGLLGYDPHLDDAVELMLKEFNEDDDEFVDNDDEYNEEDEDY
jgi:hypothetical protein